MNFTLDAETRCELEAIAERSGCELIHVVFGGGALRLIIDNPEGVTIEHCERVSREASAILDVHDFGSSRYTLEVSSPGLDRELYSGEDYRRFSGSPVRVTWRDPKAGGKRTESALLVACHPSEGTVQTVEVEITGERMNIPMADILKTRLDPQL